MICSKCGKRFAGGVRFCDECGGAVVAESGGVINNFYSPTKQPVSVGGWIGRSLIPCIPFIGTVIYFIMLFVWAGDTSKEDSFRNWAKAQLWIMLIGVIIAILFIAIIAAAGYTLFDLVDMY